MVKYVWIFLFLSSALEAQPQFTISNENLMVLYLAVLNPITISAPDIPSDYLTVQVSPGKLRTEGNCHYSWMYCGDEKTAMITVGDTRTPTVADTFYFAIKSPKDLHIRFTKDFSGIYGEADGNFVCLTIPMDSFHVALYPKNSDPVYKINHGGRFNEELEQWIQGLKSGDRIAFSDFNYHWYCGRRIFSSDVLCLTRNENGSIEHIGCEHPSLDFLYFKNKH